MKEVKMMKFCQHCGTELNNEEANICLNCGCAIQPENTNPTAEYRIGIVVLAALIPLFGLIWWLLKKEERPKEARYCGIAALISFCVTIVFYFIVGFVVGFAAVM
ncbi:MAG: hypothetical protein PUC33_02770 [Oscillospiraceae bacterium]|nr:hypothetical protein [Oscillospiraceae bacterium]MDD6145592.1 hypothetical protein [Oscillospiraceae bacterium]